MSFLLLSNIPGDLADAFVVSDKSAFNYIGDSL